MAVASTKSSEDIDTFLTACADVGVLEIVEGRWRFTHDKLRETLLRDLSDAERRDLHRIVATAIETVYPNDESYHETLLEHWREAGDAAKELQYLIPVVNQLVNVRSDFDRGALLAQRGLTLAAQTDPRRPALLNALATVGWRTSDYAVSLQWAEQAWQAAEQLGDKQGKADSLRNPGMVLLNKGDTLPAIDYYQQSLAINREMGNLLGIAINLGNLGNVTESLGDLTAAKSYTEQSLAILRSIGNRQNEAVGLLNLGAIAYKQGDLTTAHDYYQQSLSLSREIGNRQIPIVSLNNLGNVELDHGNVIAAAGLFQEALASSHAIDEAPMVLVSLLGLARLRLRTQAEGFAAELAGLVENHPALEDENRQEELATLKRELEAALPAAELAAALERGKALDLETVVQKILAENAS